MQLFHYHLATSRVREHEERYVDEHGFRLVARYGALAGGAIAAGPEREWAELDQLGFLHRLTELERDGVNVVVQPGRWEPPLVDHVGVLATQAELELVLAAAAAALGALLDVEPRRGAIEVGRGVVRFLPGGPSGRPRLAGERIGTAA